MQSFEQLTGIKPYAELEFNESQSTVRLHHGKVIFLKGTTWDGALSSLSDDSWPVLIPLVDAGLCHEILQKINYKRIVYYILKKDEPKVFHRNGEPVEDNIIVGNILRKHGMQQSPSEICYKRVKGMGPFVGYVDGLVLCPVDRAGKIECIVRESTPSFLLLDLYVSSHHHEQHIFSLENGWLEHTNKGKPQG